MWASQVVQWSRICLPTQEELAGDSRDVGSITGSGRPPEVESGNLLQNTSLENSMDRAWWATVHGVAKNQTQLCITHAHIHTD